MSKEVFESIKAGLEDAIAYAKGDKTRGTVKSNPVKSNPIKLSKEKPTKKRKKK